MASLNNATKLTSHKIVLLISLNFPPETTGGATGAWNRAMVLQKLGFKVFVLAGIPSSSKNNIYDYKYKNKLFFKENIENICVFRIKVPNLDISGFFKPFIVFMTFIIFGIIIIPKILLITSKIDIIYARSPIVFCSILGFIYSKLRHSYYIYEAPDIWPDELITIKSPLTSLVSFFGKIFANFSYMSCDLIITVSKSAADYIVKYYKPEKRVYGIPSGVDINKFTPLPRMECRTKLISESIFHSNVLNKFLVLYSGKLSSAQKIDDLIYAAEKLKEHEDIYFIVIGDGPNKSELVKLKNQKGLTNLIFMKPQKRNMMPYIISAVDTCTIFLSPEPVFDIAIPTKFYEYIGCQKPIIGICKGEVARIIQTYNIGYVCEHSNIDELVDAVLKLHNLDDSSSLANNCKNALENFSLDSISKEFHSMFLENYKSYSTSTHNLKTNG
ncbi:N/A [soil metagenome]